MSATGRFGSAGAMLAGACALASCLTPTQVTLTIRSDVPCGKVRGVVVRSGRPGELSDSKPKATTYACEDGEFGSLVVVPTEERDASIGIEVTLGVGKEPGDCLASAGESQPSPGTGCIVARRSMRFIPHRSATLPIDLRSDCLNVLCPADSTCFREECHSAEIDLDSCTTSTACTDSELFARGLVASYPLDGTLEDTTGDHDLVPHPSAPVVFEPADVAQPDSNVAFGPTGKRCDRRGACTNGALAETFSELDVSSGLTLEAWYYQPSYDTSGTLVGFASPQPGGSFLGIELAWGFLHARSLNADGDTNPAYERPSQTCWHHVAMVVPAGGSGTIDFYLDGRVMSPGKEGSNVLTSAPTVKGMPFRIAEWTLSQSKNLRLDEVRVWQRPLSPAEVARRALPQGPGPLCVAAKY